MRWICGVIGIASLLLAGSALAGVELTTSVNRVVRLTTEDGRIETRLLDALRVQPGHELRYTIKFTNASHEYIDPGIIVITNPIPVAAEFVAGTAAGTNTEITFSVDGGISFGAPEALTVIENGVRVPAGVQHYTAIRWTYGGILGPGEQGAVSFDVRLREKTPADAPPLR